MNHYFKSGMHRLFKFQDNINPPIDIAMAQCQGSIRTTNYNFLSKQGVNFSPIKLWLTAIRREFVNLSILSLVMKAVKLVQIK